MREKAMMTARSTSAWRAGKSRGALFSRAHCKLTALWVTGNLVLQELVFRQIGVGEIELDLLQ